MVSLAKENKTARSLKSLYRFLIEGWKKLRMWNQRVGKKIQDNWGGAGRG